MTSNNSKSAVIEKAIICAVLCAVVFVLQFLGAFIRFGPFSISLVLVPIIVGAAICDEKASAVLGAVFGLTVLITGDAAPFLAISIPGTIITVMAKGILCGYVSGVVYKLLSRKNRFVAVLVAAIVCPVVNTGVFVLGCFAFFFGALKSWGADAGYENAVEYIILGMTGINFLVELGINVILSPVIVRIIEVGKRLITKGNNGRVDNAE